MIFQTYKNVILRNVHSLGLCFYPYVFKYHIGILIGYTLIEYHDSSDTFSGLNKYNHPRKWLFTICFEFNDYLFNTN
jgi:hypothetical protein